MASGATSTSLAAQHTLDVTLDAMPDGLISATGPATLDAANPINGRRGGVHPVAGAPWCTVDPGAPGPCVTATLDTLGFDVTGGAPEDQARHRRQAIAALQLDAGLAPTGVADDALLRYAGVSPGSDQGGAATEVRALGASAQGRAIVAYRYGNGPRRVLVVAQTHGDEEAGLRVWLRARSLPVPAGVTLWVVPTMNPDGLVHDTRFLADGADPNRRSPAEPEQLLIDEFARSVRPELSVWYHQNYGWIGGSGASMAPAAAYHERVLLGPLYRSGDCVHGFTWCAIDEAVGGSSILVELPDIVTPADVHRHADALLAVAGGAP